MSKSLSHICKSLHSYQHPYALIIEFCGVKQNKLPNIPESLLGVELVGAVIGKGSIEVSEVAGSAGFLCSQLKAMRHIATSRKYFRTACIVNREC